MKTIPVCKVSNYLHIDKIKLHPQNQDLREITPDRLEDFKYSICKKGFYQPILVWKKNGYVLSGNHRVIAARELIKEGFSFKTPTGKKNLLPIVIEDVSKEDAEAMLHDTNNQYATWIDDKLKLALTEAEKAGRDLRKYGYSPEQVDNLVEKALEDAEDVGDTGDVEKEPKKATKSKLPEEFEVLSLPKDVHDQFLDVLKPIAKSLNDDWKEGDSITEAVQALCQIIHEAGILDKL